MASGGGDHLDDLPPRARTILNEARRGVLATIGADGRPHVVPVCFVVRAGEIVTPIDAKPKGDKPLGRRRNISANPAATFLVDHWSEDWSGLGWVMARGVARLERSHPGDDLVARYPQYEDVFVGNETIVLHPERVSWWLWDEGT